MKEKRKTPEQWIEWFKDWRSSGLTQKTWCEANGIPLKSFGNARTRLKNYPGNLSSKSHSMSTSLSQSSGLIQLHVIDEPSSMPIINPLTGNSPRSGLCIRTGQLTIELATDFDAVTLKRLLAALEDPA